MKGEDNDVHTEFSKAVANEKSPQKFPVSKALLEHLESSVAKPSSDLILKPDKMTTHSVNRAHDTLLNAHIKYVRDQLNTYGGTAKNDFNHAKNLSHDSETQTANPDTDIYEWLHNPEDKTADNVLTHKESGISVASVSSHDKNQPIDNQTPNTQLLINDLNKGRWFNGGVHHYDEAIKQAHHHAHDSEHFIRQHAEINQSFGAKDIEPEI